jgi:hypothetical protein
VLAAALAVAIGWVSLIVWAVRQERASRALQAEIAADLEALPA